MFSVLVCAAESALTTFNETESAVMQAVITCHKYAPDGKGGGGRSTQRDYVQCFVARWKTHGLFTDVILM